MQLQVQQSLRIAAHRRATGTDRVLFVTPEPEDRNDPHRADDNLDKSSDSTPKSLDITSVSSSLFK